MAIKPIERREVRRCRNMLIAFATYLEDHGDTFYAPRFRTYAQDLTTANSMRDLRLTQRKMRSHLKGTIGTINDGPPFRGIPETRAVYEKWSEFMSLYRADARRVFW